MKRLLQGIADFRRNHTPEFREMFAALADGQDPDALYIGCSDSRVEPSLVAPTDPGDIFVVRNVGNLVPPACDTTGVSVADESEMAAIEFAVLGLRVRDVIVCGHSDCGAIRAIAGKLDIPDAAAHLRKWLRHGMPIITTEASHLEYRAAPGLDPLHVLSQRNVLLQMANLKTYPLIRDRIDSGSLRLHGWWFNIGDAEVYAYDSMAARFVVIDEETAIKLMRLM